MIDKHSFGIMNGHAYAMLEGTYTPAVSGLYTLLIENTCALAATKDRHNYIDNITLKPDYPVFDITDINIPSATGGTATFDIKAGLANQNKPYWVWMSVTGTYPGFKLNGVTIPLNWDGLLQFGLFNPGFPGSSAFVGKLDFFGMATPKLTLPPDTQLLLTGIPIYFAVVFTSPGPSLPITYASVPVHIKYVP